MLNSIYKKQLTDTKKYSYILNQFRCLCQCVLCLFHYYKMVRLYTHADFIPPCIMYNLINKNKLVSIWFVIIQLIMWLLWLPLTLYIADIIHA